MKTKRYFITYFYTLRSIIAYCMQRKTNLLSTEKPQDTQTESSTASSDDSSSETG